jgi:CRP-like cAMP-binding protein
MSQVVSLPRHKLAELINHQPRMSQHLSALVARRSKQMSGPPPSPGNTEFSGNLSSMSFADVLQLLQVGRKTGYIALQSLGRKGEIGIESGEVRQARAETQTGEEAFYTLASWKGATFAFSSMPLKDAPNITSPTMPLLMEAMRRVDEAGRAAPPADGEKTLKDLF